VCDARMQVHDASDSEAVQHYGTHRLRPAAFRPAEAWRPAPAYTHARAQSHIQMRAAANTGEETRRMRTWCQAGIPLDSRRGTAADSRRRWGTCLRELSRQQHTGTHTHMHTQGRDAGVGRESSGVAEGARTLSGTPRIASMTVVAAAALTWVVVIVAWRLLVCAVRVDLE
jgi:hypothetical protein